MIRMYLLSVFEFHTLSASEAIKYTMVTTWRHRGKLLVSVYHYDIISKSAFKSAVGVHRVIVSWPLSSQTNGYMETNKFSCKI